MSFSQTNPVKSIPRLLETPVIDGDPSEWKAQAFSEGIWEMKRIKQSDWYEPKRNKLLLNEGEDSNAIDLSAQYYLAWDKNHLYIGAEVMDNVNDVTDSKHEAKRWYYKDAIAVFIEFPRDSDPEKFEGGNHAFCFVMDSTMPDYGAWWRHGSSDYPYVEESLPVSSVVYAVKMNPWKRSEGDYLFEARVALKSTLGNDMDDWKGINAGDLVGLMIVHCDPDGGEYGGHMLIYGAGDNDSTWTEMKFTDSKND